jgi:hypothetical protein
MGPNYDKRIKKGLRFISRSNATVLKVGKALDKVLGNTAFAQLLATPQHFTVEKTRYNAKLTPAQYKTLKGSQGTKQLFAEAVADLLHALTGSMFGAEDSLVSGLQVRESGELKKRTPPDACSNCNCNCVYNGKSIVTTQQICVEGYAGTCNNGKPPAVRKRLKEVPSRK